LPGSLGPVPADRMSVAETGEAMRQGRPKGERGSCCTSAGDELGEEQRGDECGSWGS
jgi:hypothetical protein